MNTANTLSSLDLDDLRLMASDDALVKYPFNSSITSSYAWEANRSNPSLYQKEIMLSSGERVLFRISFQKDSEKVIYVDAQFL